LDITALATYMPSDKVILEAAENDVAVVRLGSSDERLLTLSAERLDSLQQVIRYLAKHKPRGMVLSGPSSECFALGADLKLLKDALEPGAAEFLSSEGQKLCVEITCLPFPTVAAISGPCYGIACEIALACRYRLLSDHKKSALSVPEVELGIIPFFGATQLLPRLIGLPRALEFLLSSSLIMPSEALRARLVHEIVPVQRLKERAEKLAADGYPPPRRIRLRDRLLTYTSIGRHWIGKKKKQAILHATRGFYPAPEAALKAALTGLNSGLESGFKQEAKEFARLLAAPSSQALFHLHTLRQTAQTLGSKLESISWQATVLGAGKMGTEIAALLAISDYPVVLKDVNDDILERALQDIRSLLEEIPHLTPTERSFIINRIETTSQESATITNSNIVIEAVLEDPEIKKKVLAEVSRLIPLDAVIATNTCTLSISEVSAEVENPSRALGLHFLHPATRVQMVEIVRGRNTTNKAIATAAALVNRLGKYPIVVEDVPGFLVNRILGAYLLEATELLWQGYSISEIDQCALEFGMQQGPFQILDEIGLDVMAQVLDALALGYGERFRGSGLLQKLAQGGRWGRRCGEGFYQYHAKSQEPNSAFLDSLRTTSSKPPAMDSRSMIERLVLVMINEAVRCLDEAVAGRPGQEAAGQIDLCSVYGMGFPVFRGGVLYYAETVGAESIDQKLSLLTEKAGPRYKAAPGIKSRAEKDGSFYEAV